MASKQEKLNEIKKFLVSESGKNLTWTKEGGKKVYEGQQSIVYTTVKKIGLNNLTDSQINKFYDYVIGSKLYPKDVLETSEKAAAASPSGEGTLAGPLRDAGIDDIFETSDIAETIDDTPSWLVGVEVEQINQKKTAINVEDLNEHVQKYLKNTRQDLNKLGSTEVIKLSEKKPNKKVKQKPLQFLNDPLSHSVSIDTLETELKHSILDIEEAKHKLATGHNITKGTRVALTETIMDLGKNIALLQEGLKNIYYETNVEILKKNIFTEIKGKYFLTDNKNKIEVSEEVINQIAERQDNVISDLDLMKRNVVSATVTETNSVNAAKVASQEMNVGDQLISSFNVRLSTNTDEKNKDFLDNIREQREALLKSGETLEGGKAYMTSEIASNTIIDLGDKGEIEIFGSGRNEPSGRTAEIGVISEIGDRPDIEEAIDLHDARTKNPVFHFSGSQQVQWGEDWGWVKVSKDGTITPVGSALEATSIQETIDNLKNTPRGEEIATWMGLDIYSDKEYIKQRQELEAKKNRDFDITKARHRVNQPAGVTEPFSKPIKQGPIVHSFLHSLDYTHSELGEAFKLSEDKTTIQLTDVNDVKRKALQRVGDKFFKTYELLVASGMKLPVKELVDPRGGKHTLIPAVSESIFNRYLIGLDFLNKGNFKGKDPAIRIGPIVQDLYKNIFEGDIPFETSKGYFAELGWKTEDVVKLLEQDLLSINEELINIKSGKAFGQEIISTVVPNATEVIFESSLGVESRMPYLNLTYEQQVKNEIKSQKMMIATQRGWSSKEAQSEIKFDAQTGKQYYEISTSFKGKQKALVEKLAKKSGYEYISSVPKEERLKLETEAESILKKAGVPKTKKEKVGFGTKNMEIYTEKVYIESPTEQKLLNKLSTEIGINPKLGMLAPANLEKLIEHKYLFEGLPKTSSEFLLRLGGPDINVTADTLKSKKKITEKLQAMQRSVLFEEYKSYRKGLGETDKTLKVLTPKASVSQLQKALPKDTVDLLISAKELEYNLPKGSLKKKNVKDSIATIGALDLIEAAPKDINIAEEAVRGGFYDQLKDALKLIARKG
tara:strand:+ start:736 stop:3927 length:3192 start_codon:yes stop_codon:yes gene_type:complete